MASIDLEDVHVVYRRSGSGVHGIDLGVADGEFVALVGPSGSGKTTLLRAIAGFIRPQSGSLRIGEKQVHGPGSWVPPQKRDLGMVFQQHAIWPHWSVGRNVAYPLRLRGVGAGERRRRVEEALAQVGLEGAADRRPDTLSGGQRQRVAIARALVTRPAALLLDEALSSLDEPLRARLQLELKELASEFGLTVVHVTHDRSEALSLADRIMVLRDGRTQQIAEPATLLHEPANPFVASFMADATVVEGRVATGDGGTTRFTPTGRSSALEIDRIEPRGTTTSGEGVLAILPDDVEVVTADEPGAIAGTVRSVLFERSGYTTVIDLVDSSMRIDGLRSAPRIGEPLHVRVRRALLFDAENDPGEGTGDRSAMSAGSPAPEGATA